MKLTLTQNIYRKIILCIGTILGFSTSIVAQYGAPMAHFKFIGYVKTKECELPIPNIKVQSSDYEYVYTDSTGKFELDLYREYYGSSIDNLKIKAEDIDSLQNLGEFLTLEKEFVFRRTNSGSRYPIIENQIDNTILLDSKGISPCPVKITEDSLYPDTNTFEPDKDTVAVNENNSFVTNDTLDFTDKTVKNELAVTDEKEFLVVYPNPSDGHYTIKLFLTVPSRIIMDAYDTDLRIIIAEDLGICEGIYEKQIDLSMFAKGSYMLAIHTETKTYISKLIRN